MTVCSGILLPRCCRIYFTGIFSTLFAFCLSLWVKNPPLHSLKATLYPNEKSPALQRNLIEGKDDEIPEKGKIQILFF